jgi:zinc protease
VQRAITREAVGTAAAAAVIAGCFVADVALAYDPHQPLPADPHVTFGELDNGFRYAIRPNAKPEKRAELRLVVLAGSVDEDEDQRGLAHFVEHMVFNGTESYPGNKIVDYLESIGSRFGADLNAHTGFDETVYELQIPTDKEGLLHEGIHILSEFGFKAKMSTEEIEKERGVVLDEWRRGLGAGRRIQDKQLPVLLKGSRYAERLPIGLPEVIKGCKPDAIRRFYHDWYHPSRMALIAVGDFDPKAVETWVKEIFGPIPAGTELRERADRRVPSDPDTLYTLADDSELRGVSIGLSRKLPAPSDESTYGAYRNNLLRQVATSLFDQRLSELARSAAPPFLGAGMGSERFGKTDLVGSDVHVAARSAGWRPCSWRSAARSRTDSRPPSWRAVRRTCSPRSTPRGPSATRRRASATPKSSCGTTSRTSRSPGSSSNATSGTT